MKKKQLTCDKNSLSLVTSCLYFKRFPENQSKCELADAVLVNNSNMFTAISRTFSNWLDSKIRRHGRTEKKNNRNLILNVSILKVKTTMMYIKQYHRIYIYSDKSVSG